MEFFQTILWALLPAKPLKSLVLTEWKSDHIDQLGRPFEVLRD